MNAQKRKKMIADWEGKRGREFGEDRKDHKNLTN